jgi:hypothetical protein
MLTKEDQEALDLAKEALDMAKLSEHVLHEHSLIREHRPVFVFDQKLAKTKHGNALRQEKFREKQLEKGLKKGEVPIAILEKVKEFGGDWAKYQAWFIEQNTPKPLPVAPVLAPKPPSLIPLPVEKPPEIEQKQPKNVSESNQKQLMIYQKIMSLKGLNRWLVFKILGLKAKKAQ